MSNYNNFAIDLEFSNWDTNQPGWKEVYSDIYPGYTYDVDVSDNKRFQARGIDKVIFQGQNILGRVDEKAVRPHKKTGKAHTSLFAEIYSDRYKLTTGWACNRDYKTELLLYKVYDNAELTKAYYYIVDFQRLRELVSSLLEPAEWMDENDPFELTLAYDSPPIYRLHDNEDSPARGILMPFADLQEKGICSERKEFPMKGI